MNSASTMICLRSRNRQKRAREDVWKGVVEKVGGKRNLSDLCELSVITLSYHRCFPPGGFLMPGAAHRRPVEGHEDAKVQSRDEPSADGRGDTPTEARCPVVNGDHWPSRGRYPRGTSKQGYRPLYIIRSFDPQLAGYVKVCVGVFFWFGGRMDDFNGRFWQKLTRSK